MENTTKTQPGGPKVIPKLSLLKEENITCPWLKRIDDKITKNLLLGKIETRPSDSNGLWCSVLLPAILLNYNALYTVSPAYGLAAYISLGLFLYFALLMVFISISSTVFEGSFHGGAMACSLTSTLLVYSMLNQDLLVSLALTVSAVATSGMLLRTLLKRFPKTYTLGEASVMTQSLALAVAVVLGNFLMKRDEEERKADLVNTIVYTALGTVAAIIGTFSLVHERSRTHRNFVHIFLTGVAAAIAVLIQQLGTGFLFQFGSFISQSNRLKIILVWLSLVGVSVGIVYTRVRSGARADTRTRKVFHVLASGVFASGLLLDRELMKLAAGVALAALIFLEALRKLNLEPYSSTLQSAFDLYADEKDMGGFAMTPIYLFLGLACPLALVPAHPGDELELLSGVLSIGIGDSAASCLGSRLGTHKWPGSEKTFEGTAANMLSQIFIVYALQIIGLLPSGVVLRAIVAAVISSLVEAGTTQVDNLILPLVTILAFQATFFL